MTMPDAVDALLRLAARGRARASTRASTTSPPSTRPPARSAISVLAGFPEAEITFEPDLKRQAIVDTWPADVDDRAARADWGLAPRYDLESGFADYLIPRIRERYRA